MGFIDEEQRNSYRHLNGWRTPCVIVSSNAIMAAKQRQELNPRVGVDLEQRCSKCISRILQGSVSLLITLAALGPIDYFNVQDKMAGREIDRGRWQKTIRSNQAGEALTARGQDIQIRGQNISAQNVLLFPRRQRAELQEKALDSTQPEKAIS
ncbi:phage DNA ejection protein [Escherichia coli]